MFDEHTQRPRGFGFITFDAEDSVDRLLHKVFHEMNDKLVEVKRALPKDANPGGGSRCGSDYQGYGASGGNASDGQMAWNRYMQNQTSAGGYAPYSSYAATSYGYGEANSGVSHGGYGSFGVGGYGGGPAGEYGMATALKNNWGAQVTSIYTVTGYAGNAASVAMGQSQGGAFGYGGYGYGNMEPMVLIRADMELPVVVLEMPLITVQALNLVMVMVMPMGIQDMEIKAEGLILHKHTVVMGEDTVVLIPGRQPTSY